MPPQSRPTIKSLLVLSDLHCGHATGLTAPSYNSYGAPPGSREALHQEFRARVWDLFSTAQATEWDAIVVNGDAIDGKGERSGGTELLQADRNVQVQMAVDALKTLTFKNLFIIAGTPYHTGKEDNFELALAYQMGLGSDGRIHFGRHEWISLDAVTFDFRHKVAGSSSPGNRTSGLTRAQLWNRLWALRATQPEAQVIVRSHVHYYSYVGDARGLALTTPALQGWTNYGSLEMDGTNDIGFLTFEVEGDSFSWTPHLLDMHWARVTPHNV